MQAASLPVSAGWFWIRAGYALFRRQPLAMFSWALTIGLLVLLASLLVPLGPAIFILLMPAVSVMTLNACRDIAAGNTVRPLLLWRLLRQPGTARRLLGLGGIYLLGVIAVGILGFLPFYGNLEAAAQLAEAQNDLLPLFEAVRGPLILSGLLYLLLAALFWHAPVLVAWHDMGMRKALFFSGIACWRNKGAFVVYGLAWAGLVAIFEMLAYLLQSIGLPNGVVSLVQMPLSFVLAAVLYCSFYPTYTTVFGDPDAPLAPL
ncbi:MAG: BPSS1780 family membrane protein [Pigmentiphaga sp.]